MEILIFKDKMWNEIPEQDNPTFDYFYGDPSKARKHECILISKALPYKQKCVGKNGYSVIFIPLIEDVVSRGIFWNLEDAELFANALSNQ